MRSVFACYNTTYLASTLFVARKNRRFRPQSEALGTFTKHIVEYPDCARFLAGVFFKKKVSEKIRETVTTPPGQIILREE
jgi:hypothetical protein